MELDLEFIIDEVEMLKREGQLWVSSSICNDFLH